MRVALAQINMTVGDLSGNCSRILVQVRAARDKQADIVVFPELAVCGYPPEDLLHKDHFVQDNIKALRSLVKEIKGITAVIGFVDKGRSGTIYNAAAVIADKKIRGVYRKQELPNYGVFDEKRYFAEGREAVTFSQNKCLWAVSICEDIWKDPVPSLYSRQGVKLLLTLSSSPFDHGKREQRERLFKAVAKKHSCYLCYCNLVGGQDELVFDGGSLVVSPQGRVLAAGKQFEEDLVLVDIPDQALHRHSCKAIVVPGTQHQPRAVLPRHKAERLTSVERVYRALVLGTRDYLSKNGFQKAVVGLSGGIDSSLVSAIAVDAIGADNVVGVTMPSRFTSVGTRSDAGDLAQRLGIKLEEVPIEGICAAYQKSLEKNFVGTKPGVTEENLQARIRGNILMAFSNKFGWLVLTTGNKSEVAVGYCTLYGDMSGGFAVIKDVPKSLVYDLALLVNSRNGEVISQNIIKRAPSAELRENQTDQDSLPPYDVLDSLLKGYVEKHESYAKLRKRHATGQTVEDVIGLVDKSEYKRRQSPPGIKISSRAFGKDWRLPITNKYKEF